MKRTLLIAALVAASATLAAGQTADKKPDPATPAPAATSPAATSPAASAQDAVVKLAKDWVDAENRRDGAALDRLLADDFVGTDLTGGKVTKKMVVPDPKGPGGGLSFTADDYVGRVYEDVAVVTGNGTWKTKEQGTLCFTLVFVKRQDRWQMVTAHVSNVSGG